MLDFQTAKNLIMSKEKILLLTHQKIDVDGLASILAFGTFLENLGKEVKIISTNEIPDSFEFLPFTKKVQISKNATKDFVISLKLNGASIEKLKYNTEGDKLNIVISPKNGEISQEGISFAKGIGKFDLIICADTASLENLGDLYFENTNLFFETPIINIDHHVTNGGFGQINLVDITSASATMIIFDLIKIFSENWKEIIDEDLATLLMAGLITDTGSFQYNNTSPKALEYAADLMDLGARQQEIIKNIYKTKQLSMLKIWGKILTNIKEDPISRVVWSEVDKNDFIETGATINEADGLIDELMTNAPGSEVIILAKEGTDDKIYVSLRSNAIAVDMAEIAKEYGGGGHKMAAGFVISEYQNFDAEIGKFIEKIQIMQKNRLGISEEDVKKIEENKPKKPVETKKDFSAVNVKLDLPEIKKEEKITEKPKSEEKNISETKEKPVEKKS
ncbi:DHHA1 domain-containing protein, partial [Candidatus Gracilibacteria bacterium]|nr:DHHA1 domain-containing protein [Candidatus Gracilibacteria bacterium]